MVNRLCDVCGRAYASHSGRRSRFCSIRCKAISQSVPLDIKLPTLVHRSGTDECWPIVGVSYSADGYGKLKGPLRSGDPSQFWTAHRVAYAVTHDLLSGQMSRVHILHTCDNPPCCNPAHLYVGDPIRNVEDRVARGRSARGEQAGLRVHPERAARGDRNGTRKFPERVARGERVTISKLTEADVRTIRTEWPRVTQGDLAAKFNVSVNAIQQVLYRKTWAHVT
jgi:hypothetical protein